MLKRKPRARRRRTPGLRPYVRWLLRSRLPRLAFLTALGPGLISGFADNDAGGITTYSVVGAQFGYDLMWVVLASMVALAITQEVGARLGLATGQGFGGLIRQQYGVPRAAFAIGVMLLANLGDTVAEFAGIGAALAIFGVPIWLSSALAALARGAAIELAARGVRVNVVRPGPITTPILDKTGLSPEALEAWVQNATEGVPLGRFGSADDVAHAALYLASDDAAFVTGHELTVDGGMLAA